MQARIDTAEAVTERVDAAQALLEGHRALHRRAHQVETRFPVAAVAGGAFDVGPAALQSVQGDPVGRRVDRRRHEGFHAMRDGVHAGGRRELGRQAQRQVRVADGGLGHQVPGVKAQLAVVVHDDDGAARHFAAGAAGGGHRDQRRDPVGDARRAAFDGGVVGERAFVGRRDRHALGTIDGRAAAHGDQAVAAVGLVHLHRRAHRRFGGIGRRLVEHRDRQAGQGVQRLLQHPRRLDAGIGHEQRPGDAHPLALLLEQLHGAEVELDLGHVIR